MGIKEKLFGGPQNAPQQRVDDSIVNPQGNIAADGSVTMGGPPVQAQQNPFMQFVQQQQQPNYPVLDNNQRFGMTQPNDPNGHYAPQQGYPQQQYDPQQAYGQPQQQYDPQQAYGQPQQQYDPQQGYPQTPQAYDPTNGGQDGSNSGF